MKNFFTLTKDNVIDNQLFYSTDPSTAPADIKFRKTKEIQTENNGMDGYVIQGCF